MPRKKDKRPDWFKVFRDLYPLERNIKAKSPLSVADAFDSILRYFETGEETTDLDPLAQTLYDMMKIRVDEAYADYAKITERNTINGSPPLPTDTDCNDLHPVAPSCTQSVQVAPSCTQSPQKREERREKREERPPEPPDQDLAAAVGGGGEAQALYSEYDIYLVEYAMSYARAAGARNCTAYARTLLKRWKDNNIRTLEQAMADSPFTKAAEPEPFKPWDGLTNPFPDRWPD